MYRIARAACTTDTGLGLSAEYTYTDDLLTSIETPSSTYNFTYGDFDLRTGVSIGSRTLATYKYAEEAVDDRKYDLDRLDYGNGDSIQYEYDDKGRVTKQTYEDGSVVDYWYDNNGALAKTYDWECNIGTVYYYDFADRLMKYEESGGWSRHSVGYEYDDINNLTKLVETVNGVEHTTSYTYDEDNRVTEVNTDGRTVTYTYDAYGRVSQQVTKNGSTTVLTEYFTYHAPTASTTTGQIATHRTVSSGYDITYTYTYDDNGNILSVSDGTNTTSYVYDSANQLIRENNQAGSFTHTWTYDNAGNILARREYAYTTGELGTPTHTASYTYGDSEWGDLLTGYDGKTITSDQIGNMLSDGTWNYTWKCGRKLAGMSDGSNYYGCTYDANGMRVARSSGITNYTYVYNGSSLSQMTDDFNKLDFTYDANGRPTTVTYNGTLYYYVTNLQGDVVAILNNEGAQVVSYTYDAWGNILSVSGSMANTLGTTNPLRYRGYVYDIETGLYYLQSRYYDPKIGRFISADAFVSTGQGLLGNNMFAYCGNNPVNYMDATGESWKLVVGLSLLAIAVIGIGVKHIVNAVNKKNISKNLQESYTTEEAGKAVEEYLNSDTFIEEKRHDLIFKDDTEEVRITNSNEIKSSKDRLTVTMILDRTEGLTDRSPTNMAAEWAAHNVAYDICSFLGFSDWAERSRHVDINYGSDGRIVVDLVTGLFQVIGWV